MIKINMFSQADKVGGQGVGSAYDELIGAMKKYGQKDFDMTINSLKKSDITHYHTINPRYYLLSFFKNKRGVGVGSVHFVPETLNGSLRIPKPFKKIFDWYLISFYKRMDGLVVVNPEFVNEVVKLGISKEKVTYIPNFVSSKEFYEMNDDEKKRFRQKLGIKPDKFVVLGVGQIQKRKGFDDFVKLAKQNPDIQFIWAGGFSFGKITDGYDSYKKIYDNPPANMLFTGIIKRKELASYYNIANLFLLPSYSELFPMSILEALNCNTPIMLRNLDLYVDILGDSYLAEKDVTEMDQNLKYYSKHEDELKEFNKKSRKWANLYSEESIYNRWKEYYISLLNK
ncbi:glycosyltransferase family 4 protein [Xylocopilactobacillus apis]|uniref:Glycosyl transferase n=1 Tax=Xylocopilactobacillus apis TaxID=2932183 RepID=A0AAU9CZ57_9LACO|nr:glycosyltransferase family 4 protein [Xylocopilactobacillus apis]BDR56709.1 glycosyl transferase [Xylocopilactobacillus apis]